LVLSSNIFIAGHNGLVGSALVRRLEAKGFDGVMKVSREDLDLRDRDAVNTWFRRNKPDVVVVAAGKVGGISTNARLPVDFLSDNLRIAQNIIEASHRFSASRLMYLSSNCVYPKHLTPPHTVEMIGTAEIEKTNEWYGYAKICGMKLCEAYAQQYGCGFFSVVPTSTFGPGDCRVVGDGHVIPDLIMKSIEKKIKRDYDDQLKLLGSGNPIREYLFVDDLADALVFVLDHYQSTQVLNIGGGTKISIADLAHKITNRIDQNLTFQFDKSSPDGASVRFLDNSVLNSMGWAPKTEFDLALEKTISWYEGLFSC
jgi:GDP-L-fucose synthase